MSRMPGLDEERRRGIAVARLAFFVTMLVVGTDQAVKVLVLTVVDSGRALEIAPGLYLIELLNTGTSYGLGSGRSYSWLAWLLISLGIAFSAFAALGCSRPITGLALGLFIGGGLSNLIDRVRFGAVLDYLQLRVMGTVSSATNLANLALFFGLLVLLIDQFFIAGTVYVPAASRVARSARPWFRP
jgi:signal peptidase II